MQRNTRITTEGYFNPDEVMTRADFTSTILKALGHKDVTNEEKGIDSK